MNRSFARLAAALLVGSALAGCSTLSFDAPKQASAKPADAKQPPATTNMKSMAADLDTQVRAAQAQRAQGNYQAATTMLSQLMLVAPDDPRVVGEYGKTLVQQGRSKEALDFLRRAVELQSGDWTLYSAVGIAYDETGDYGQARLAYQQALSIKPGDAGVLNNYALSRMQAGDLSTARQLMTQAQATGANDPKIVRNVALLASLTPADQQASVAAGKSVAAKAPMPAYAPPKNGTVVMQSLPSDPLAGPVKEASSAPHRLVKDAAPRKSAKAASKKAPAANKTPSLRMTADATAP